MQTRIGGFPFPPKSFTKEIKFEVKRLEAQATGSSETCPQYGAK